MVILIAIRLAIAAVLAAAAVAKLRDLAALSNAATNLGLSPRVARLVGQVVAPLELGIALLLLARSTAWIGSVMASIVFAAFAVLIGWNLLQGRRVACACFGETSGGPISAWTLLRNLLLMGLALSLTALDDPGPGILELAATLVARIGVETSLAIIGLLAALQTVGIWLLFARHKPSEVKTSSETRVDALTGWPPGVPAPAFDLPNLDGERVTLAALLARSHDVLLVFVNPTCGPCQSLLPEIARWQRGLVDHLTVAVVSQGTREMNLKMAAAHELSWVLLQGGSEVEAAYRCPGTPSAVIVDRSGRIASRASVGGTAIRRLFEAWTSGAGTPPATVTSPPPPLEPVAIGDPGPPFRLPDLRGGEVDLIEFVGRPLVLVFWSPTCTWCQRLKPDLQAWERSSETEAVPLVIVSRGSREMNEALGFLSPVLLDDGSVSRAFAAAGTPASILLDANGHIASSLATGGDAVMETLRRGSSLLKASARLSRLTGNLP